MTKKRYGRHITNTFSWAGKDDNKHGIGIFLIKKCKQRIVDTEYINEVPSPPQSWSTANKLMNVYFTHSGYADHHIEKMYRTLERHTENCKRYIPIIGGDFNAELGLGHGNECKSVGRYALNEGNKKR